MMVEIRESCGETGTEPGFFAELPLIFRPSYRDDRIGTGPKALARRRFSGYTDIITVEDTAGAAAFIGLDRGTAVVLARREAAGDTGLNRSFVIISAVQEKV
jgi:hypothetical protein